MRFSDSGRNNCSRPARASGATTPAFTARDSTEPGMCNARQSSAAVIKDAVALMLGGACQTSRRKFRVLATFHLGSTQRRAPLSGE